VVITSTPFVPMRAIAFLALGPPRADGVAGEEHLPPGVQQSGGDRTRAADHAWPRGFQGIFVVYSIISPARRQPKTAL
jgi:hypothetical protein